MHPASKRTQWRPALRALGLAAITVVAAFSLLGCGQSDSPGKTLRYVIKPSPKASSDWNAAPSGIPKVIHAQVGDRMVVENRTKSLQIVAGYPIAAGDTISIPLNRAGTQITACSTHKDKTIKLVVRPR